MPVSRPVSAVLRHTASQRKFSYATPAQALKNPRIRACRTCQHPERSRIESLLAGGASLESLARKFALSKASLYRHLKNHVHPEDLEILRAGPAQLANLAERAAAENMSILDYLSILRSRLMRQLSAADAANDSPGVCRVSQALLAVLQEIGKLTGEIERAAGIVINQSNNQTLVLSDSLLARIETGLPGVLARLPWRQRGRNRVLCRSSGRRAGVKTCASRACARISGRMNSQRSVHSGNRRAVIGLKGKADSGDRWGSVGAVF
jgi:hypothetical protein